MYKKLQSAEVKYETVKRIKICIEISGYDQQ